MDFLEIAQNRQSCRNYNPARAVEQEKLDAVLEAARLAPSACNGQPYHLTVCSGDSARQVAAATMSMGMNKFVAQAPIMIVISEEPYVKTAALGAKLKGIDYRSIDIGIVAAYITAEAAAQGLGTCMIGWLDDDKIRQASGVNSKVHLVISLGYPDEKDTLRTKKRKERNELITEVK